ncbi:hypothetical protein [Sulfurovum sp.]
MMTQKKVTEIKKKWAKPTLSKIALKLVTLSGTSGMVEQNSGQGARTKRA